MALQLYTNLCLPLSEVSVVRGGWVSNSTPQNFEAVWASRGLSRRIHLQEQWRYACVALNRAHGSLTAHMSPRRNLLLIHAEISFIGQKSEALGTPYGIFSNQWKICLFLDGFSLGPAAKKSGILLELCINQIYMSIYIISKDAVSEIISYLYVHISLYPLYHITLHFQSDSLALVPMGSWWRVHLTNCTWTSSSERVSQRLIRKFVIAFIFYAVDTFSYASISNFSNDKSRKKYPERQQ